MGKTQLEEGGGANLSHIPYRVEGIGWEWRKGAATLCAACERFE